MVNQVIKGKSRFQYKYFALDGTKIMDILFRCIRMERRIRLSVWCLSEPIRHKKMQPVNKILGSMMALLVVMFLCIVTAML